MSRRKNGGSSGRRPLPILGRAIDPLSRAWDPERPLARTCGDCRLCCIAPPIQEADALDKPAGVACAHLCDSGCGLYADPARPTVCHQFACNWLRGDGAWDQRPDRMRALPVFAADRRQCALWLEPGLTPDTLTPQARRYISHWHRRRRTAVLLVYGEDYGTTTALWPDGTSTTKDTTIEEA